MRRGLVITVAAAALLAAGAPAASASTRWAIQPTPIPARANEGALNGISCAAAASCTAAGFYGTRIRGGDLISPLAEHWDGSTWAIQLMPSPAGATGTGLNGVSCASAASCTAVGFYTTGSGAGTMELPLAEHWDGSTWAIQLMPSPSGARISFLSGVSCAAAASCTAVGSYFNTANVQTTLAEYWNGSAWAIQATPSRFRDVSELLAVSCTAPGRCTAVGNHFGPEGGLLLVEHSSAGTWRVQPIHAPSGTTDASLSGVSCVAATSCTAVGDFTTGSGNARVYLPLAEHWDGSAWAIQPAPGHPGSPVTSLGSVSCVSKSNCTAAGIYLTQSLAAVAVAYSDHHGTWRLQATRQPGRSQGPGRGLVHLGQQVHRGRMARLLLPAAGRAALAFSAI